MTETLSRCPNCQSTNTRTTRDVSATGVTLFILFIAMALFIHWLLLFAAFPALCIGSERRAHCKFCQCAWPVRQ